jgi:hypothetical protein
MEYMEDHLTDWLGEELAGYGDEDYLVLDCPGERTALCSQIAGFASSGWVGAGGAHQSTRQTASLPQHTHPHPSITAPPKGQIELYNHVSAFRSLVDFLKADGWSVCVVYCLDCHFVTEAPKYIAGAMQVRAVACMSVCLTV